MHLEIRIEVGSGGGCELGAWSGEQGFRKLVLVYFLLLVLVRGL